MNHTCRDCGERLTGPDTLSRCPVCNSMYLIPQSDATDQEVQGRNDKQSDSYSQINEFPSSARRIPLGERWWCAFLGFVFGGLTFFIWLIEVSIAAVMFDGLSALESFQTGIRLSVVIGVVLAIFGFAMGADRLAHYMGLIWGTSGSQPDGGLLSGLFRLSRIVLFAGGVIVFIYYLGVRGW